MLNLCYNGLLKIKTGKIMRLYRFEMYVHELESDAVEHMLTADDVTVGMAVIALGKALSYGTQITKIDLLNELADGKAIRLNVGDKAS